jgi:hypothetical protein
LAASERLTISTSTLASVRRIALRNGSLITAVGTELRREGIKAKQPCHQQHAAVATLDIGAMDDGVDQQT